MTRAANLTQRVEMMKKAERRVVAGTRFAMIDPNGETGRRSVQSDKLGK